MTRSIATLGEIAGFVSGGTPSRSEPGNFEGDIPWITGADIGVNFRVSPRSFITREAVSGSAVNLVDKGTLLLVTRTAVGKVAVTDRPLGFSQDITAIQPDPSIVDTKYLAHFLSSRSERLAASARGATIKGVQRKDVSALKVPLPPLPEQRRIASLLDHAESLRVKRLSLIREVESATEALFEDDRLANGSSRETLGELLLRIDSGTSPVCTDRPANSDEWGVLKLSAVTSGQYDSQSNKAVKPGYIAQPRDVVRDGDILLTRKNTPQLVGASAYVFETPSKRLLPDLIFRLVPGPRIDGLFLQRQLATGSARRALSGLASGSAASMSNISKERLRTLEVMVPPLSTQLAFAERARELEAIRRLHRGHLALLEELFASLQHRAFTGQL